MKRLLVTKPVILPPSAYHVWQVLREAGYECLFAGGWVRDLWMNRPSEDVDLATSATPEEVMKLFPRCLPLGQRFGSVVVLTEHHGSEEKKGQKGGKEPKVDPIEVTTFRRDGEYLDGRRPVEIHAGTPIEDAHRRDFTINGLFFDPQTHEILDAVGGLQDIEKGLLRAIGIPKERFTEDRLRLLRAVRFAARFGFSIEPMTLEAICQLAPSVVEGVSSERIWQELTKMQEGSHLVDSLHIMNACGLLEAIFGLRLSLEAMLKKLSPLSPYVDSMGLVRTLANLWMNQGFDLPVLLCLKKLETLNLSNLDKKRLERLHTGYQLFLRDRELSDRHAWLCWLNHPESAIDCLWLSQVTGDLRWAFTVGKLSQHPLLELMKKEGAFIRAHHLAEYPLAPGRKLGELLYWLNQEASRLLLTDRKALLSHMSFHPQGLGYLARAKKNP